MLYCWGCPLACKVKVVCYSLILLVFAVVVVALVLFCWEVAQFFLLIISCSVCWFCPNTFQCFLWFPLLLLLLSLVLCILWLHYFRWCLFLAVCIWQMTFLALCNWQATQQTCHCHSGNFFSDSVFVFQCFCARPSAISKGNLNYFLELLQLPSKFFCLAWCLPQ